MMIEFGTEITKTQERVHRSGELAAILGVAPFLAYLSTRQRLTPGNQMALAGIAVGTLLIDGWLLSRWEQE